MWRKKNKQTNSQAEQLIKLVTSKILILALFNLAVVTAKWKNVRRITIRRAGLIYKPYTTQSPHGMKQNTEKQVIEIYI